MKRLCLADYRISVYFWAEPGEESTEAELALELEVDNNVSLSDPEVLRPVGDQERIYPGWESAIPWGDAPEGFADLTVEKILKKLRQR